MMVTYLSDMATVDQLNAWWPAALEKAGWVRTSGGTNPDGRYSATYYVPGEGRGLLAIDPDGTLWDVTLILSKPSP